MGEETFGIWCSPDLHIASSKEAADTTTTTPRRYRSDRSGRGGDACNAGKESPHLPRVRLLASLPGRMGRRPWTRSSSSQLNISYS
jgi:hypothetical protein